VIDIILLLHNCHDIVQYCLLKIWVPESITKKYITFRNQDNELTHRKLIEFSYE